MARPYAPFWLVWSPSGDRPPAFRHQSAEQAETEADRLAVQYPGREFYVLEPRTHVVAQQLLKQHFAPHDEVPF